MAITHVDAQRNIIADGIYTALGASFRLVITTVDGGTGTDLAVLIHNATVPAAATGGVLDFFSNSSSIAAETNAVAGTAAGFRLETTGLSSVLTGAVAASASDINLSSTGIGTGDTVTISALTYTAPV